MMFTQTDLQEFSNKYSWISEDFVINIMKAKKNSQRYEFSIRPARTRVDSDVLIGDLIQLDIKYFTIDLSEEQENLIMKEYIYRTCFNNEVTMFKEVLPKVVELLNEQDARQQIGPSLHSTGLNHLPYIIFENPKKKGYKFFNSRIGLDLLHLECVMEKLAKYHAATAVLLQRQSIVVEIYSESDIQHNLRTANNALKACIEVCKKWEKFESVYRKLLNIENRFGENVSNALKINENEFNVIGHGNLWTNSIMFKSNDDLIDSLWVDFDCCYWGSPVFDICSLLYMSSSMLIQEPEWYILIGQYYQVLKNTLKKLDYIKPIPEFIELLSQVKKRGICFIPNTIFILASRDLKDKKHFLLSDEGYDLLVAQLMQPEIKKQLEHYMNVYDRMGYFD